MGRGTLRTNWDPDVMADNINPCWLAEGIFFSFFPRDVGTGEGMGKVMAFWQAGGCAWTRVAQLQALMGAVVA